MAACMACGGEIVSVAKYRFKSQQFRDIYPDGAIYRCRACELRQARVDTIDDGRLSRYYGDQYRQVAGIGGSDAMFIYRPRAEGLVALARQHVPGKVTRIFEVGAGHGINLAALGEAFPGAELFTDEVDTTVSLPVGIQRGTLEDGPFDIVLMSHVLEHFTHPVAMLDRAAHALAPGGVLLVEVPNDTLDELAAQEFHEPHVGFFELASLRSVIARTMDVVDCYTVGPPPRRPGASAGMKQRLKRVARGLPLLKPILDRRRSELKVDLTTRQDNGAYLRAVARAR